MEQPKRKPINTGKASRQRGHKYENEVARRVREFYPNVITSRAGNRLRDYQKIDLCHGDEIKHGQLPLSIQCKCSKDRPKIEELLACMEAHPTPLVSWQKTWKNTAGRFMSGVEIIALYADDFWNIYRDAFEYRKLKANEQPNSNS
jgi:hypothetical protein